MSRALRALAVLIALVLAAPTSAQDLGQGAPAAAPATPAAGEDIRDIRGPEPIPAPFPWLAVLAAAAVSATAVAGVILFRRRQTPTLADEAFAQLADARVLLGPGRAREVSIVLSDIVREYVEARFDARAAHRTTEEFLAALVAGECEDLEPHREALGTFLGWCDRGKYAAWELSAEQLRAMHASAEAFVRHTAGRPAPRARRAA